MWKYKFNISRGVNVTLVDRSYDTRDMSPVNQKPPSRHPRLPPVKSFNNFMSCQDKSTKPEDADDLYKDYLLKCTEDASNHFFESNKYDEWFREKFDPLVKVQQVPAMKAWAQKESAALHTQLRDCSSESLASFRLAGLSSEGSTRNFKRKFLFNSVPRCSFCLLSFFLVYV